MSTRTLEERFDSFDDDYLDFPAIESPRHRCADLCAFLMLADLLPELSGNIISASEHDEFYLGVDCEKLNEVATDEQLRDLVRCGIRYDAQFDCLCMFS